MAINIRQRFALEVIVLKSVQDALWVGRYVAKKVNASLGFLYLNLGYEKGGCRLSRVFQE